MIRLAAVAVVWAALCAASLSVAAADAQGYQPVHINNGSNTLHIASHEVLAFRAWRENFNAHGFDVVTLYMQDKEDGQKPTWNVLPIYGDAADAEKEHLELTVGGGADCVLHDFRLLLPPDGHTAELVVAQRDPGESFADAAAVHFDYYVLTKNVDGVPGWPRFYFKLQKSAKAKSTYCDVNEAFDKELHLGVSSGEGGPGQND